MSDRVDFYFRQRVTEAELDLAFSQLENADRNLAADIGVYGVISGAVPAPHSPVANLSIDLTAPGRAYDHLGQRIFFGTGQVVDCSVDLAGIPTDVSSSGSERWLGVFIRFRRQLSDARTDGNSQQIFFRRDEAFEIVVRQAPVGPIGSAPRVALQPEELLICDVRRGAGQTQILAADIETARRQAFIFAHGSSVAVVPSGWSILQPVEATAQATFDEIDAELKDHFGATGRRHNAADVGFAPHGYVTATNVQAAINEFIDDLATSTVGNSGATRVLAESIPGTPNALSAGTVKTHIASLLGFLNNHQGATSGAHHASAIAATAHTILSSTNVQSQLQELVNALRATTAPSGASQVGVSDTAGRLNATNVEQALAEVISAFGTDHQLMNEASGGQHRTIQQPSFGGTQALLWDSMGVGEPDARFRVYADSTSVWFLMNAAWDGLYWVRDGSTRASSAFRMSRYDFEFMYDGTPSGSFTSWEKRWRLPMIDPICSGLEVSGPIVDSGRAGLTWTNSGPDERTIAAGGAMTFRCRYVNAPSSITLVADYFTEDRTPPMVVSITNTGFGFFGYRTLSPGRWEFWMGTYTVTV